MVSPFHLFSVPGLPLDILCEKQILALRRETELIDLNDQLSNTEPRIVVVDAEPVMDENEPTLIVPIGDVVLEERIQVVVGEWVD